MRNDSLVPPRKTTVWDTKSKECWDRYTKATDENNKLLTKAAHMTSDNPEDIYKIVEKVLTKTKFTSFGKIKIESKIKEEKNYKN